MRQKDTRNAVGIVLGSTVGVPLQADGRVLTCFVHLLFTDNRQGGTNTCNLLSKCGLDERMIVFFLCQSFFHDGHLQMTGQMRDESRMWDTHSPRVCLPRSRAPSHVMVTWGNK